MLLASEVCEHLSQRRIKLTGLQMVTFCVLVAPIPQRARRTFLHFLQHNTVVAKIAYALKISFMYARLVYAYVA